MAKTAIFAYPDWKRERWVNDPKEDQKLRPLSSWLAKGTARRLSLNFLNLDANSTMSRTRNGVLIDPERYKWGDCYYGVSPYPRIRSRWGERDQYCPGNLQLFTINFAKLAIECMGIEDKSSAFEYVLSPTVLHHSQATRRALPVPENAMAKQFPCS